MANTPSSYPHFKRNTVLYSSTYPKAPCFIYGALIFILLHSFQQSFSNILLTNPLSILTS